MNAIVKWLTTLAWAGWGPATILAFRPGLAVDIVVVLTWAAAMALLGVSLLWLATLGLRR